MTDSASNSPSSTTRSVIREVSARDVIAAQKRGEAIALIDVREPNEWNLFRLAGARHIPISRVAADASRSVPHDGRVVVYCARGARSAAAAAQLQAQGFTNVESLAGGIMGWVVAGGEVEE